MNFAQLTDTKGNPVFVNAMQVRYFAQYKADYTTIVFEKEHTLAVKEDTDKVVRVMRSAG